MNQSKVMRLAIIGFLALMGFLVLTNTTFLTIDPGEKGVLFKPFGGGLMKDKLFNQGFHVVAPWNRMYIYDVRIKEDFEKMQVLSKNGLQIEIELSFWFSPISDKIGYLHDEIGPDYVNRILKPQIRSATREVIGKYLPEELYSTQRETIQTEIFQQTKKGVEPKNILLDAILIREVKLPLTLQEAIERKLKEEQASLEYEFKLTREKQEAERIIIEANAKAEANRILSSSLTDRILQDKGIDATLELANSPNSKVIVVGSGDKGLPLILGSGN
ncbi:MAG: prohibitin family protein [Saprospiraceae bacterium]|nr:prohibitin family protein [Saprospiraceae bacterium]